MTFSRKREFVICFIFSNGAFMVMKAVHSDKTLAENYEGSLKVRHLI